MRREIAEAVGVNERTLARYVARGLSLNRAAAVLDIHPGTLTNWRKRGMPTSPGKGGALLVAVDDVRRWMTANGLTGKQGRPCLPAHPLTKGCYCAGCKAARPVRPKRPKRAAKTHECRKTAKSGCGCAHCALIRLKQSARRRAAKAAKAAANRKTGLSRKEYLAVIAAEKPRGHSAKGCGCRACLSKRAGEARRRATQRYRDSERARHAARLAAKKKRLRAEIRNTPGFDGLVNKWKEMKIHD